MKNRLTAKSKNVKTGPIPVSTTERASCPKACPLRDAGCYADNGPLAIIWDEAGTTHAQNWTKLCNQIEALPEGQFWRHNQAGDLPHKKQIIDVNKMNKLIAANVGRKGFTYTHHDMTQKQNRELVAHANAYGFAVNLSANSLAHADKLKKLKIGPVVTILPSDQTENTRTPAGNRVIVCPAAIDRTNTVNCKSCKLCARIDRDVIVGFPAHGPRKKIVDKTLA